MIWLLSWMFQLRSPEVLMCGLPGTLKPRTSAYLGVKFRSAVKAAMAFVAFVYWSHGFDSMASKVDFHTSRLVQARIHLWEGRHDAVALGVEEGIVELWLKEWSFRNYSKVLQSAHHAPRCIKCLNVYARVIGACLDSKHTTLPTFLCISLHSFMISIHLWSFKFFRGCYFLFTWFIGSLSIFTKVVCRCIGHWYLFFFYVILWYSYWFVLMRIHVHVLVVICSHFLQRDGK